VYRHTLFWLANRRLYWVMTQNGSERHVRRRDEPELYEHLESLMFSGATEVEVDSQTYNAARDKDEDGNEFFVLTPVG